MYSLEYAVDINVKKTQNQTTNKTPKMPHPKTKAKELPKLTSNIWSFLYSSDISYAFM